MALIELNLDPTGRELKWFGAVALVFFGLIGWVVHALELPAVAVTLWSIGVVFFAVYYAIPPLRIVLYRGWLKLFHPLGWLIAHVLFGFIFFVVFTLVGFGLRLTGYDPLRLRRPKDAGTYWAEHGAEADSSRYFRQF